MIITYDSKTSGTFHHPTSRRPADLSSAQRKEYKLPDATRVCRILPVCYHRDPHSTGALPTITRTGADRPLCANWFFSSAIARILYFRSRAWSLAHQRACACSRASPRPPPCCSFGTCLVVRIVHTCVLGRRHAG